MLVTVSIVSAQAQLSNQELNIVQPTTLGSTFPAKFNYQAVVRDRNNHDNLVMNQTVNVTVEILIANQNNPAYTETHEVTTNRNGMVSFIIGESTATTADNNLANIDWSNATIKATFKDVDGNLLSEVLNPIMPVPLALQAANDPMEITTDKIVEYLSNPNTKGEDVGAIVNALTGNPNVKNAVRDSIISYIKTQPDKVKELAIYFLGTVTVNEAKQAYDTLDAAVKQKIKQILVDSIKANRALAYQIAADYLKNTTKEEVKQLWLAARANEDFHEIFDAVRDSAITYVMNHPQYMMTVAQYYIKYVLTYQDVQTIYQTLRDENHNLYVALQNKFNDYLESYIGDNYLRNDDCPDVNVCDLKEQLDEAKAGCPDFFIAPVLSPVPTNAGDYNITVYISGLPEGTTSLSSDQFIVTKGETAVPTNGYSWTVTQNAVASYTQGYPLTTGDVLKFELKEGIKSGCPAKTTTVTVQ